MNQEQNKKLYSIISEAVDYFIYRDAILEALRYRALRKLNIKQYTDLRNRNLKGKNFDEMVDKLILDFYNK